MMKGKLPYRSNSKAKEYKKENKESYGQATHTLNDSTHGHMSGKPKWYIM